MRRTLQIGVVLQTLVARHGQLTEAEGAAMLNVSTTWFRHDFKRHAGVSFRAARLKAKLEYGAELLDITDLSIPDISALLLYSDRTKFEKAFKRAYKLTPSEYRHLHS